MRQQAAVSGAAAPVLVIGGGLAGGAAACRLAQLGRAVELVERSTGPHDKVCGEFLSWEGRRDLDRLGLDLAALGGLPIDRLLLSEGRRSGSSALPFEALSVTRRVLDEALLDRAARLGVRVRRGVAVREMIERDGVAYVALEPDPAGRPIVLATGKHALRGAARRARPAPVIGFKTYLRLSGAAAERLSRSVELHLFNGGYAGLAPLSDGRATLALLVEEGRYAALGGSWRGFYRWLAASTPSLAALLAGAAPMLERPLAVAALPYGFVHRAAAADPANVYRVGDQLAVVPSLSGDGMAMAIGSGIAAAEAICAGVPARAFHEALGAAITPQMRWAGTIAAATRWRAGRATLVAAVRTCPGLVDRAIHATRIKADFLDYSRRFG